MRRLISIAVVFGALVASQPAAAITNGATDGAGIPTSAAWLPTGVLGRHLALLLRNLDRADGLFDRS